MFHMYVGVRAGGGIGDEIEDPAGDEFEVERIIFDITFFFFVIVILLAIIQGESHTHVSHVFTKTYRNTFYSHCLTGIDLPILFMWKWKKNKVSVSSTEYDTCHSKSSDAHAKMCTYRYKDTNNYDLFQA